MTSLLARGLPVVDIDHHVGEPLIAPLVNTLVDETASSTAELAAQLLPENRKIGRIVARALLAGIISDTSNLRFKVTPVTYETVAALTRRCGGRVDLRSMFFDTQGVDTAARALIRDLMKRSQERCVQIAGTEYHLKFVVVGRDGMPAGDDRWRVPLSNELGFGGNGTSGCDLVLLIYPTPDKYRGSLRDYNKGMQLDLRQVAGAISSGGGQPGAVGFDFAYESFADDAAAVDSVLTAIQSHAVPFSPAT
jgi:nanoRNase/pAp phosphatase (c-di-AMP/oligoRNAs hydrolase)